MSDDYSKRSYQGFQDGLSGAPWHCNNGGMGYWVWYLLSTGHSPRSTSEEDGIEVFLPLIIFLFAGALYFYPLITIVVVVAIINCLLAKTDKPHSLLYFAMGASTSVMVAGWIWATVQDVKPWVLERLRQVASEPTPYWIVLPVSFLWTLDY
jgi:hypothetical protein